jgi:uncharacterized protein (TIGR02453 family)
MEPAISLGPLFSFLEDLGKHNNKAWFDAHRPAYEAGREAFEQFTSYVIDQLRESDQLEALSARECISRINRDIRFSKDKSPYRTNLWASIAPGGRKATRLGYHIAVGPGHSIVAGGLYMPMPDQLARFRSAIDEDAAAFKKITSKRAFVENFGTVEGERLKTAPQGYDRGHPEINLLQLKQVTAVRRFTDKEALAPDFPAAAVTVCRAMRPFLDYLNEVLA